MLTQKKNRQAEQATKQAIRQLRSRASLSYNTKGSKKHMQPHKRKPRVPPQWQQGKRRVSQIKAPWSRFAKLGRCVVWPPGGRRRACNKSTNEMADMPKLMLAGIQKLVRHGVCSVFARYRSEIQMCIQLTSPTISHSIPYPGLT